MSHECCHHDHQEHQEKAPVKSEQVTEFKVIGMDCSDEIAAIEAAFKFEGIQLVDANLVRETVTIYHDRAISTEKIKQTIEGAGVRIVQGKEVSFYQGHAQRILLISSAAITLSIALALDLLGLSTEVIYMGLYLITIALAGATIFPKAFRSLRHFKLDMNVLMTVAVIGAILIKEYSEAASVVFLFALAELLEAISVSRARKAIKDVLKVSHKNAQVYDDNEKLIEIPLESLVAGHILLIRPGETIPIDGVIIDGQTNVNQASLTGESRPISKKIGDEVWAGTLNELGIIKVRAEKEFKDTKIARVISLVEEAQAQKAPSQKFVDKFSAIYTPSVLGIAILVALVPPLFLGGIWNEWIYRALVFLVIGCPCALVIATPVSVVSGLTSLARRGVLVKGGVYLEALGKLKAMALDKTGTITEGVPKVSEVKYFTSQNEDEVLKIIASLESMSTHPLAKAILHYTANKGIQPIHPTDYKNVPGKGAQGQIDQHWYFVGNHNMAHAFGICTPEIEAYLNEIESKAMSVVVLGHLPHEDCAGEIWAIFAVGDNIRSNASEAIRNLHRAGIDTVAMLSGDNQKTVSAVANQVGIDYAKGSLLPDQKVAEIKLLVEKHKYVGMVGDGVNDAPALAHASIGIAMGVGGSDTAIETADVALMKDDLLELPKAIAHGKRVLNIIRFNIYFAIAIKAVFFILAFFGMTNLWMAVVADMGASLIVTFNALRLLKHKT